MDACILSPEVINVIHTLSIDFFDFLRFAHSRIRAGTLNSDLKQWVQIRKNRKSQ